jgi:hypothetical protein
MNEKAVEYAHCAADRVLGSRRSSRGRPVLAVVQRGLTLPASNGATTMESWKTDLEEVLQEP